MTITFLIIIVTVGASFYAWQNQEIYGKWIMNPYKVNKQNQYFRFLTSGLIHANHIHLLVNMLAFYSFSRILEMYFNEFFPAFGSLIYLGFYVLAIVVSELPTYFKHKEHSWYNSLGASGAVSAVVFAMIIINPLSELRLFFIIPLNALIFGVLFLIYSFYAAKKESDHINHDAHFYGAVFGIVSIILIEPALLNNFLQQLMNFEL